MKKKTSKPKSRRRLLIESLMARYVFTGPATVIDLDTSSAADPRDFVQVSDIAFFTAQDATNGRELWKTDGTAAGTSLVADIRPGTSTSDPKQLTAFGDKLFFVADDGVNGEELWMSDGTASGTVIVRDINAGSGYQYPYGTGPLRSFPRGITEFNGELFFAAEDAATGGELWKTDGTTAGTVQVADVSQGTFTDNYGTYPRSGNPQQLTVVGETLFFTAYDTTNGRELWKTDGTVSGTSLVRDIDASSTPQYDYYGYSSGTSPNSSSPAQLTSLGGLLFFVAADSLGNTELWKSDGTNAGTVVVTEIGSGSTAALSIDDALETYNGRLYFAADDGISGKELWSTDGTAAGTRQETDLNQGISSSIGTVSFGSTSNSLYFAATDGSSGTELYRLTTAGGGAAIVSDINLGSASSNPQSITAIGDRVFFSATTTAAGTELWESDGTDAGTVLVDNIASGTTSSSPSNLFNLNGKLLLTANTGTGVELLTVDPDGVNDTATAKLTVYINGVATTIPANIGVDSSGNKLSPIRTSASGAIEISPIASESVVGLTLGDFFSTWRTNAGVAGNNASATFDQNTILGSAADATQTVKVFVNGQVNDEFDNYVINDGDEIAIIYGSNPVVSINTNFGPLLFELFEGATPITVQNFLNYINDGDYINSFFHRSVTDFVIQGGGFTTTSTTFTSTSQFGSVPTDATIQNEFGISSTRGTVAMAKLGGDPNSATSQFFVNLSDANTFLDTEDSGEFTVFARVLDMSVADTIAALPINTTNESPYGELPLSSDNQLVVVQSIEGTSRFSGTKFNDLNSDGVQDSGEVGLAGVTIYIDSNSNGIFDTGELSTVTDATGQYLIEAPVGTTTLRAQITPGATDTSPNGRYVVVGTIGSIARDLDFGENSQFNDSYITNEDTTLTVDAANGVLANDSDSGSIGLTATLNSASTNGTVSLNSDGSFTYSPNANFNGTDSFTYMFSDGVTTGTVATATIVVTAVADAPTTTDDSYTSSSGATKQLDVLANDSTLPDTGQTLTITSVTQGSAGGQVAINGSVIDYTAPVGFVGTDTFTYSVVDNDGLTSSSTVSVQVDESPDNSITGRVYISGNGSAVASSDGVPGVMISLDGTDNSGNAISQTVLTASDGSYVFENLPAGTYAVTENQPAALVDGSSSTSIAGASTTSNQLTNLVLAGGQTYSSNNFIEQSVSAQFIGLRWFFASTVYEQVLRETLASAETLAGNTALADAILNQDTTIATPGNIAPVAVDDAYSTPIGTTLTIAKPGVLSNDVDSESDVLMASVVTSSSDGTLTLATDGSFTYVPNTSFVGIDTFVYQVVDAQGLSSTATATINVTSIPNEFAIAENSVTGTIVGTLSPQSVSGSPLVYEVINYNQSASLDLRADDHISGNPNGSVILIEYTDFQCPVCLTYHPIVEQLKLDFPEDLMVVTRHLPLESVHFNAFAAAVAAEAAGRQGAFDAFGDALFDFQSEWADASDPTPFFESYAVELGLDVTQFQADMADPELSDRVQRDLDAATSLGNSSTPTFYLDGNLLANPATEADFASLVQSELAFMTDVFAINRLTGAVSIRDSSALDYETTPTLTLEVNVVNVSGDSETINATINLIDVAESTAEGESIQSSLQSYTDAVDEILAGF